MVLKGIWYQELWSRTVQYGRKTDPPPPKYTLQARSLGILAKKNAMWGSNKVNIDQLF